MRHTHKWNLFEKLGLCLSLYIYISGLIVFIVTKADFQSTLLITWIVSTGLMFLIFVSIGIIRKIQKRKTSIRTLDVMQGSNYKLLFASKKYDEVIELYLENKNDNIEIPLEDLSTIGLAYFQLKDYEKSYSIANKVVQFNGSLMSWFNVMIPLIYMKELEKAKEIFCKIIAIKNTTSIIELSVPFIKFYYASAMADIDEYSIALESLKDIVSIYCQLKITDDTFLYIRGVPFFSNYISLLKRIYSETDKVFSESKIALELLKHVDSNGKELINH